MPSWRKTIEMREAGVVAGFQGADESNEDFAERLAWEERGEPDDELRPEQPDDDAVAQLDALAEAHRRGDVVAAEALQGLLDRHREQR